MLARAHQNYQLLKTYAATSKHWSRCNQQKARYPWGAKQSTIQVSNAKYTRLRTVISSPVSRLVKNSQSAQSSTPVFLTCRQTRTLPSMPPVAASSPSNEKAAAITESVWPDSLIALNVDGNGLNR